MKKIIPLCTVLLIIFKAANGQDKKYQYHPWSEFQGDTMAFLEANFPTNKFFVRKSLETVLHILDKEMPVKQVTYLTTYPDGQRLQTIELIFDDRKQWKNFDQLHFFIIYFDKEYTLNELQTIFKSEPKKIIPLTDSLRLRLSQFIFQEHAPASIFTATKLSNLFNMTPETQEQTKDNQ